MGAILGLGIDRKLIGDIYTITEGNSITKAYLFCQKKIKDFLLSELSQVGRHQVSCNLVTVAEIMAVRRIEDKVGIVPSLRLDVVIGETLNISRSKVKELIEGDRVAVNSASVSSSHYQIMNNDIVSVRGFGKFIFYESLGRTKKDRIQIHIGKYC